MPLAQKAKAYQKAVERDFKTEKDRSYQQQLQVQLDAQQPLKDLETNIKETEQKLKTLASKHKAERKRLKKEKEKGPFISKKAKPGQIHSNKRKHDQLLEKVIKEENKNYKSSKEQLEKQLAKAQSELLDRVMLETEVERIKGIVKHKETAAKLLSNYLEQSDVLDQERKKLRTKCNTELKRLKKEKEKGPFISKKAKPGQIHSSKRKHDQLMNQSILKVENLLKEEEKAIREKRKKLLKTFNDEVAEELNIDVEYANLLRSGILLLPSDMRLGGLFPEKDSVRINEKNVNQKHELLYAKAVSLVMEHGLYKGALGKDKKRKGLLTNKRKGCICIMYIKEGDENSAHGAQFRPFFGASGMDPFTKSQTSKTTQEKQEDSYKLMGLPVPEALVAKNGKIRYAPNAVHLKEHLERQKRLGVKLASKQAQLYFLQVPEHHFHHHGDHDHHGHKHDVGDLESWMPSNCAEPAIMTAIYQLNDQVLDISLSVPFEGQLSKDGKLLLKYTCARCASSEPEFLVPIKDPKAPGGVSMRPINMRSAGNGKMPQRDLQSQDIIGNATAVHPVYREKEPNIFATMWQNQLNGFMHLTDNPTIEELEVAQQALLKLVSDGQKGKEDDEEN